DDLGSGALLETVQFGLAHEPMVQQSIDAGVAVVCFSGDKLLGGPQAGIIVGKAECVDPLRTHPLTRALRPDKLCLAGLQETLLHYLREDAVDEVPVWRMIGARVATIEQRAQLWRAALQQAGISAEVVDGRSAVGGGSLPGETLPTKLLVVPTEHPDRLATSLRHADPPVVGRIEDDRVVLDPRTVLPEEDQALVRSVAASVDNSAASSGPSA
ncbi:MAG: L-seryl-tRNA(Sec) selenium transferase, partial [Anaerolineae bacterium]